jgi:hypothetical protein
MAQMTKEKLGAIDVPPTTPAPTKRLCWQRPAIAGDIDPMLPPCDRASGHDGKHSWELPEELRMLSAELKQRAESFESTTLQARILFDVVEKLERLVLRG